MKRAKTLALVGCALALALLCCGCSAKSESPAASGPTAEWREDAAADMEMNLETAPMAPQEQPSPDGGAGQPPSIYQNTGAKLIRRAELNLQTTQFDQTVQSLEDAVEAHGGYFEHASVYGGSYRDVNAQRSGEYVIRVPAEEYAAFLSQAGELGYVTRQNESSEDVGEPYYDTEARLKTQRVKQERLLSLLEKAENMEDIISLENALSEVEYQIEQLSSTLNRYDSLVGFATIDLTLEEVHKVSEETGAADSLGKRMAAGFAASAENLVQGFQDTLVWASYHVFGLLIFGAVLAGGVVFALRAARGQKKQLRDKTGEEEK